MKTKSIDNFRIYPDFKNPGFERPMRHLLWSVLALFALVAYSPSTDAAENTNLFTSSWTKVCLKGQETNGKQICLTGLEGRLELGGLAVAVVLIESEGTDKKILQVIVPLGMQIVHGTRVTIDQRQPIAKPYVACTAKGCAADYEADAETIQAMQVGKILTVQAINMQGTPISFPLPLGKFADAYKGSPTDQKLVDEKHKKFDAELKQSGRSARPRLPTLADPTIALAKSLFELTEEQTKLFTYSLWKKSCGKDGNKEVCVVTKDGKLENGVPVVIVQLFEPEGQPKVLRVTVPLGMQLQRGTRIILDQGSMQKPYLICFPVGCMSDFSATDDMVANMKKGKMITVQAINTRGMLINLPVPLNDFATAYDGPATDQKVSKEPQKKPRRN